MVRTRPARRIGLLLIVCAAALSPASTAQPSSPRTNESPRRLPGQSATHLSDGRWLLVGGRDDGRAMSSIWIFDPATNALVPLPLRLAEARGHHSATVLADGSVLVLGGVTAAGTLSQTVERIDVAAQRVDTLTGMNTTARADHSATLLTDGRVLLVGGLTEGGSVIGDAEILNTHTGELSTAAGLLRTSRSGHEATLLADGGVRISGGRGAGGQPLSDGEIFEPGSESFVAATAVTHEAERFEVSGTVPVDGAFDVPVDAPIVVRLSAPLTHATIPTAAITLTSSDGEPVTFRLVATEQGRLLFLHPTAPLKSAELYRLALSGVTDRRNRVLETTSVSFTTRREEEPGTDPLSDASAGGLNSPWRQLPPLQAPGGVTALAGQVLRLNGAPLRDVTLRIDDVSTRTDRTGRFLLAPLTYGRHELVIDGRTANTPGITYGVFEVGVKVEAGKTTALDYTSWMPRIDTAHAVTIPSPTTDDIVIRTPAIPGLELHLPRGTVIRDIDGNVSHEVSITAIPVDQPPFPLPRDVYVPVYFTVQPGGGYVYAGYGTNRRGARLVYPNYRQAPVGDFFDFWHYDPDDRGWFVYGQGGVSDDRRQIIPDPGVQIYEFTGAMVANPGFAPPEGGCPCTDCEAGDPVDLSTGLFVLRKTDLALPDHLPVGVMRTYRTRDSRSRAFGIGASHEYDMYIVGDRNPYTYIDIVHPCGTRLHFDRITPGTSWQDATYEHVGTPGRFFKARIDRNINAAGWTMRLKDGTDYVFPDAELATRPEEAALLQVRDRYGNTVTITRTTTNPFGNLVGDIASVTGSGGSRLDFTYTSNRITQVRDNIGRTVAYEYNSTGRLWKVTDAAGGVTEYGYDGQGRMRTIKDPRGITFVTNAYDANARVSQQTMADGGTYQFAYTLNAGKVTQADVTDPRGVVRRMTFNGNGNWITDTRALGRPEQQMRSVVRTTPGDHVLSHTDALNRRTDFGYDAMRNVTSVTLLAGTPEAVTRTATYESNYNQVTSFTNPLNKTTLFERSARSTVLAITDPLGHRSTMTENVRGQIIAVTDAVGTAMFEYAGSVVVASTDALGHTTRRVVDGAGRTILGIDALGRSHGVNYSALNLPTRAMDALGGETELAYDGNGNPLSVTDARDGVTSYTYDVMDQLESRTDALGRSEHYAYDLNGNVIQFTDRRGQVTNYSYDALDRLTLVIAADGSTTSYAYDSGDRITQVTSPTGIITLGWDGLDRLTAETGPNGTVTSTYDAASRRETMTVGGQPAVVYTYDDADRVTQITQGTSVTTFDYDAVNRRTLMVLPNGVSVEYGYDGAHRLTALTYTSGTNVLGTLSYSYDATGRRLSVGGSFARTRLPSASASSTYNAGNQLTQRDGTTFTYDLNGNLTSDGARTMGWNTANQLAAVGAATSGTFQYDPFGRRQRKVANGVSSDSLYDGHALVQELSSGVPTAQLLNGLGIDEVLTRTDASRRAVLPDALGSTVALVNDAGALATQYTYEPFGATAVSGEDSKNTAQFTGREADGSGFYYYRARYYDPLRQRFVSEDPIEFAGGDANLYGYVLNDPASLRDPFGLASTLFECLARCVAEHYGIEELIVRGAVGAGAIPLPKDLLGLPRHPKASRYTNPYSYIGHLLTGPRKGKLGVMVLGTNRIFGLLGRLNLALGAGLAAYDAVSIGMCINECLNCHGSS